MHIQWIYIYIYVQTPYMLSWKEINEHRRLNIYTFRGDKPIVLVFKEQQTGLREYILTQKVLHASLLMYSYLTTFL